jgi:hypothetical protein
MILRDWSPDVPTPPPVWTQPVNISINSSESVAAHLGVDSDDGVHVVWMDNEPGNFDIYYKHKPASGGWSPQANLSENSGDSGAYWAGAALVVDDEDTVHVIWADDSQAAALLYTYKPLTGTWSSPVNITTSPISISPAIAVDRGGALHATWSEHVSGNWEILYSAKPKGGSWTTPTNISGTAGDSYASAVEVSYDGTVHVVWEDYTYGAIDILYSMKAVNQPWLEPVNLSSNSGGSLAAAIAVSTDNRLHVVWEDGTSGTAQILYTTRQGAGPWTPPLNISNNLGWSMRPSVAADPDGNVFVVWSVIASGASQIYYSSKTGNGSWAPPTSISEGVTQSSTPSLVWSDNTLHVVWEGDEPQDVYYSTAPLTSASQ